MPHSPFADAFEPGARFRGERDEVIEMEAHVLGALGVESGRLCAADPLTTDFDPPPRPFAREVPKGRFPVELAIARLPNGDRRVACARVRFDQAAMAARWEPAVFDDEPPSASEGEDPDAVPGYGVDAGVGCFFDSAARATIDESTSAAWLAALEANQVDTWTWHVANVGDVNVVMFSSGWGDGVYGSYWGFDASGRLVELVTDFELLLGPTTESVEVALPAARGRIRHPVLSRHAITARVPFSSRSTIILDGEGAARVELSDGSPVEMLWRGKRRHYKWQRAAPEARAIIRVMTGVEPLARL